jgi:hypothetical protein
MPWRTTSGTCTWYGRARPELVYMRGAARCVIGGIRPTCALPSSPPTPPPPILHPHLSPTPVQRAFLGINGKPERIEDLKTRAEWTNEGSQHNITVRSAWHQVHGTMGMAPWAWHHGAPWGSMDRGQWCMAPLGDGFSP